MVACSWRGGPAHVDPAVLGLDVGDEQVAVAQHLGVVDVDGAAVCAAPGDDGPGLARGHALQDGALVQGRRDVLRPGDDARPLGELRPGGCRETDRQML